MSLIYLIYSLLVIHVICGSTALLSSFVAMCVAKGEHQHRRFGSYFFYGMTGVFVTAIPIALLKHNLFLFLIALFSYYLAFTGWRYAKNRHGVPTRLDWGVTIGMLIVSIFMLALGFMKHWPEQYQSMTLIVFGAIGTFFSLGDIKTFSYQVAVGKERIAKHLSAMLGATIAALTAFVVTNIHIQPKIILWLGPTVLIVPFIAWWQRKVLAGTKSK